MAAAAPTIRSRSHLDIEPVVLEAARDPRRLPERPVPTVEGTKDTQHSGHEGTLFLALLLSGWTNVFCVPGSHTIGTTSGA
jgi:hypothetical protein